MQRSDSNLGIMAIGVFMYGYRHQELIEKNQKPVKLCNREELYSKRNYGSSC